MKNTIQLIVLLLSVTVFNSCKKTGTLLPSGQSKCTLVKESTTLNNSNVNYEYTYGSNGKISSIKEFEGSALEDSVAVGDESTAGYELLNWPYSTSIVVYNNSLDLFPTKAQVSTTENTITSTNQFTYFFYYDNKNRLYKVGEETEHVIGDYEYDLTIYYNDQDNVTGLKYEFTTGPRASVTIITATGYDDKPTPFAGIKNWPFIMHAAWNNYDPEPLLTALSKNNPLGYTLPDGTKREMQYTYNDNGFPTKRMNTNIATSGDSYYFEETFEYACQ